MSETLITDAGERIEIPAAIIAADPGTLVTTPHHDPALARLGHVVVRIARLLVESYIAASPAGRDKILAEVLDAGLVAIDPPAADPAPVVVAVAESSTVHAPE